MPASVLIVDDHPRFRAVARELLNDAGYVVIGEAAGAAEGVAMATAHAPDVVILDIQLPDGDGFEVAARLAQGRQQPAIVLVSTREAEEYGRRVERCGARGFVSKSRLSAATLASVLT
jgi:DNA-binding NarL/FixJ family response regulator